MLAFGVMGWVLAVAGAVAAAYAVGLYRGERGRREDVQFTLGILRSQTEPIVEQGTTSEGEVRSAVAKVEIASIEAALAEQLEAEGRNVSPAQLREEAEHIYESVSFTGT